MWKLAFEEHTVRGYFLRQGIEWHYITPESPWQGGFYERLIRSVKRCLSSAIGRSHLQFSHFTQLLCRVENKLNCRPLTYQSVGDINTVPLRPIDFLQPLADPGEMDIFPEPEDEDEDYEERTPEIQLLKLHRKQQAQLAKFRSRWRAEYLPSLRETQRAPKQSGRVDRIPEVGEFVLVDDDEPLPRAQWKFARVMELIPGRDGTIRHVRLKFPGGAEAERAVQQLYPFELKLSSEEEAENATNPLDH
ncbi:Integrase core domain containing protein [Aphelenchoides avenae]|nr:Integrase core domain containing protein [Aphelenchus avenae]